MKNPYHYNTIAILCPFGPVMVMPATFISMLIIGIPSEQPSLASFGPQVQSTPGKVIDLKHLYSSGSSLPLSYKYFLLTFQNIYIFF